MIKNEINATVTPEEEAALVEMIDRIKSSLPFAVDLTQEQRLRMSMLSPKKVDFVDKSLHNAKASPYLPSYVDLEGFERDVELRHSLYCLLLKTESLAKCLKDTLMTVESQTYRSSRAFYKAVKSAALSGEAQAEEIRKTLAPYFKHSISKKEENSHENNTSEPEA